MSQFKNIRPFMNIMPEIDDTVFIDPSAQIIGRVMIGAQSSVWPQVSVRGDVNFIRIGDKTNIQDNSSLHVTRPSENDPEGYPLIIGNGVTVGHSVTLHACTIGDHCLVGMGAVILDGAVLHDKVFLAAGSLVPPGKELEGGYLWRGSPAQKARKLTDEEMAWLEASADNYVLLKDEYMKEAG